MFGLNPYLIIGALVALLAVGAGGYVKGYRDADRSALLAAAALQLAHEKAAKEEALRQAAAARDVAERAAERQVTADQQADAMKQEIEDYARALADKPAPAPECGCAFDERDVERLRAIGSPRRDREAHPPRGPLFLQPRH